ncbi:5'/3'-nucleotidase SurE [Spirochaeta lutea]|uniref:5'/3'-nucleotidase SurE n=1 Tax=Spirochaeta lutea TaxID=1480694 RepID=UPI00055C747D|nr:5'/3'-nucleotidase SurE [Spirochaeta lutea]
MTILLTNDDGFFSPGLKAMKQALLSRPGIAESDIWIIAPDGERSGMSHSITLKDPIKAKELSFQEYAISGSPADCVITAVLGILPQPPDIVFSGINLGPNLGTDITYSGTAAAARQAAYMGIPGVALSLVSYREPFHFDGIAEFAAKNLEVFIKHADEQHFLNINGPNTPHEFTSLEVTHPCRRMYNDKMISYKAPRGDTYWFLDGSPIEDIDDPGSDWDAVKRGALSISPIHLHPLNNEIDKDYESTFALKKEVIG